MIATVKCLLHGVACAVLAAPLMQLEASFDQLAAKCSSSWEAHRLRHTLHPPQPLFKPCLRRIEGMSAAKAERTSSSMTSGRKCR